MHARIAVPQIHTTAGGKLSHELRTGSDPDLRRRRGIIGLSLAAAGAMGFISLYQTGLISHLPEPPLPYMNADEVDASPEAYQLLTTPDAVLGLASYAGTMVLAAMGGRHRAERQPWIPVLLAAKVGFDVVNAGKLSIEQWTKHRAFCFWCLLAAASSAAMMPLVIPEAWHAWTALQKRSSP